MRITIVTGLVIVAGCVNAPQRHDGAGSPGVAHSPAKLVVNESVAPPTRALDDLDAMTFDCPKAGLNARQLGSLRRRNMDLFSFPQFPAKDVPAVLRPRSG